MATRPSSSPSRLSAAALLALAACPGERARTVPSRALGQAAEAEDDFRRAIDILAAVKHEVELARAYQGLAQVKERAGLAADALKLRHRAADIFNRLRGAAATATE